MKKILISLFCLPLIAKAQPPLTNPSPFGSLSFIDKNSIFKRPDLIEEGTYFFPEEVAKASVKLKNGRVYTDLSVMLNLLDNELLFRDNNSGQLYASIVPIEAVDFADTHTQFKTGYPPFESFNENSFYKVIAEGNMSLLKAYKISYSDREVLGRTVPVRKYDTKEYLAVYDKKKGMQKMPKTKDDLALLFTAHSKEMDKYISDHKINFKSEQSLRDLFNYYNSL